MERAIRELESFSYSVSHDLRAPLRHINSYSAILDEEHREHLPCEAHYYLDRIREGTTRMGSLIDHILDLSRVSRTELTRMRVDLSELATGILCMLQATDDKRCIEVSVEEGLSVQGDLILLSQLLQNLLENAWKYSSGKRAARIEFGRRKVDGKECYFVADNGVGFDMNYENKLFQIFQRLHGSEFSGTGIGLAIAHKIIQRHGGSIWGEGKVDEGATFYFTLP